MISAIRRVEGSPQNSAGMVRCWLLVVLNVAEARENMTNRFLGAAIGTSFNPAVAVGIGHRRLCGVAAALQLAALGMLQPLRPVKAYRALGTTQSIALAFHYLFNLHDYISVVQLLNLV